MKAFTLSLLLTFASLLALPVTSRAQEPAATPQPAAPAAPSPTPAPVVPAVQAPAPAPVAASQAPATPAPQASLDLLRDPEVIKLFANLPVQDNGRIKPLDTVARFRLLRFHGKQSLKSENEAFGDKKKLSAMEWLLITWFRPDLAKDMPVFVVDNSDAVIEVGLPGKNKRDRYSFNELEPGRELLMRKMQETREIDPKKRNPVQRALAKLSTDFLDYEMMLTHFEFAKKPFGDLAAQVPAEILPPDLAAHPRIVDLLPRMAAYFKLHPEAAAPMVNPWMREYFRATLGGMMSGDSEHSFRIFPPTAEAKEVWEGPGTIMETVLRGELADAHYLADLADWQLLSEQAADSAKFKQTLQKFHDTVVKDATARTVPNTSRNEYKYVPLEVKYHKSDYFTNSLIYFIIGLLALAVSWAAPAGSWGKICRGITWLTLIVGSVYATVGIVIRCIIMQRPPVTTLYETILFITATAVILSLIAEVLSRKGIALIVAALSGVVGMFMSIRYMNMEGTDTLQQLQAVLITNFWLATHVPCINLGYSAGMVAAIISMVYFTQRFFRVTPAGSARAKDLTRISYGFVIVGLFLSLVGTVLGGIWANYSWGRFWGWDPKENGALMIVIMNLIILHARLGGYIREVGFHACNIILGMIVMFSWFGVNQLGVGLHSYGFTDGVMRWLMIFWASQLLIIFYAIYLSFKDRRPLTGHLAGPAGEAPTGLKPVSRS